MKPIKLSIYQDSFIGFLFTYELCSNFLQFIKNNVLTAFWQTVICYTMNIIKQVKKGIANNVKHSATRHSI